MILLLDTSVLIWWINDDKKLGRKTRSAIINPANLVYVSSLTLFECSIKAKTGKLKIDFGAVDQAISTNELKELRFDTLSARQFIDIPKLPMADPFDAALIAQAISKNMTLVTSDEHILNSRLNGLLLVDARK